MTNNRWDVFASMLGKRVSAFFKYYDESISARWQLPKVESITAHRISHHSDSTPSELIELF